MGHYDEPKGYITGQGQRSLGAETIANTPRHTEEVQRETTRLREALARAEKAYEVLHQKLERGGLLAPSTPSAGVSEKDIECLTGLGQEISAHRRTVSRITDGLENLTYMLGV